MALFKKGQPKTGGRKKGTPNKKKLKKVSEIFAESGIDPVANILTLIDDLEKPKDKLDAWLDLLSYCQAKPKEYESDDGGLDPSEFENLSSEDLLKLVPPVEAK